MKGFVQALSKNSNYIKALEWSKLLTIAGSAQVVIQAIGLISGILVIRLLPTQQYALYTLANTILGAMVMLSDGGIGNGVMAQGAKVWQDRDRLGTVIATGMQLRKQFAIGSLIAATPVLLYLLLHHGADWLMAVLLFLALIPAFFSTLSGGLLETASKLRQDITPLQKNQVGVNVARLILLLITLFIFPWAFVAILAAGLPQIYGNIRLKKISVRHAKPDQLPDPAVRQEILTIVKRTLPNAIYYSLSGQLTTGLISFFGSTAAVAEIGALNRLAMVLGLFNILFNSLILPRFARLPEIFKLLLGRFIQIWVGLLLLSVCIAGTVWMFSTQILWVLGPNYSTLTHELFLSIIGTCLAYVAIWLFSLSSGRGWVINPLISIPISIAIIICGTMLLDVSNLKGILMLNIFVSSGQIIMHGAYGLIRLKRLSSAKTVLQL